MAKSKSMEKTASNKKAAAPSGKLSQTSPGGRAPSAAGGLSAASKAGAGAAGRAAVPAKGQVVHRLDRMDVGRADTQARVELKERLAKLSAATSKIVGLKRAINKNFFDIGLVLNQIRDGKLYEVKGYGSFEAFIEREIDINRTICLRSARIAEVMTREVAVSAGLERAAAAVAVLDGDMSAEELPLRPVTSPGPSIPIHKQ